MYSGVYFFCEYFQFYQFQLALMQTRQPGTLDESICQLVYCTVCPGLLENGILKTLKSFPFGRCCFHLTATTVCFVSVYNVCLQFSVQFASPGFVYTCFFEDLKLCSFASSRFVKHLFMFTSCVEL